MEPNERLLGNVIVRLLYLHAEAVADLCLLCERIKTIPGLPQGFFDGVMDGDPAAEKRLQKDADRYLYAILGKLGAALRETAPDLVEFTSLADELEEYVSRLDPAKETISGPSASPGHPDEAWLRRVMASLDPPDPPPSPRA